MKIDLYRVCTGLLIGFLTLGLPLMASSAEYDNLEPRKVSTVLPAVLIEGPSWKVDPEVIPVDGLFQFQMSTPWGDFPVYGEAMLRLRIKEFWALDQLDDMSSAVAGVKGVGVYASRGFTRVGNAFIHPVLTVRAIPQGARRLFNKLKRYFNKAVGNLNESEEETGSDHSFSDDTRDVTVWLARKYGRVGGRSRKLAQELGVDRYTSNELLADEIERLAKAEAWGSVSTDFLLKAVVGPLGSLYPLDTLESLHSVAGLAYTKDWREIFTYNAKIMKSMGVSEELIGNLEASEFFTPMTQSLLVGILDAMGNVSNRAAVVEQATLLINESEALFFLESVLLAEWYHREQKPLAGFVLDTLIPVATTRDGNLVAFTAADYFYWTPESESLARDFTNTYSAYPGGRVLVMADYASPLAIAGIQSLGWSVISELRKKYDVEIPWGQQDY